ncbi:sporulation delaying protein family toxin [Streptomyces sp. NPDC051840]|uniref:sporulation delaying protein family toxin n=1 Tax=unclassified Streptomyces TaxID=2593676 RepID=UPI003443EA55
MKRHGRTVSLVAALAVTSAAVLTTTGSANASPSQVSTTAARSGATASALPRLSASEDGRRLFAGVFFGQGAVAGKLSAAGLLPGFEPGANKSPEASRAVAELTEKIEQRSPGIFAEFSAKSRSGDPRLVEEATAAVSRALVSASDSDLSAPTDSADCVTLVVAVAVAAVVIGVATGAFVVNAAAYINVVVSTKPSQGLPKDELLAGLTKTLKTV